MRTRTPFAAFALLVLASLACGLGRATPLPPELTAAVTQAEVTPTEIAEAETVSLLEALTADAEPGSPAEAKGVIAGLRYLVGELSPSETFGDTALVSSAGTGVVRLAQIRFDEGAYEDADRAEIARILAILVPPREILDKISSPAAAVSGAGILAAPSSRPLQEPCRDLWSSGFTLPLAQCLLYESFSSGTRTYRILYPSYWPEGSRQRSLLAPALESLRASVELYNSYGPEPVMSTDIVLMDLDLLVPDRVTGELLRDPTVYAAALYPSVTDSPDPGTTTCRVGVFPAALEDPDLLRQTLAHELFHCYQYTNLRLQEFASRRAGSEWWVEGSAEFFGSVVYPNIDEEFEYLGHFRTRSSRRPLTRLDYDAYPFFLYLARQAGLGPQGVIGILRGMPRESGGLLAEQQALAAVPDMEATFHEFGRAYLDQQLEDYSGRPLPLEPSEGPAASFGVGTGSGDFPAVGPFRLKHYRLHFDDDTRFTILQTVDGTGKVGVRSAAAPGAWGQVPSELNTSCADNDYIVLITGAVPPGTDPIALILTISGEPVDEEIGCDECVLGTWRLDNATYFTHLTGLWPEIVAGMMSFGLPANDVEAHPTEVFGAMTITFKQDGTANGSQEGWGYSGEATGNEGTVETSIAYSGTGEAAWRIETDPETHKDYLVFSDGVFDLTARQTFMRMPLAPRPTGGSNDLVFLAGLQTFFCDADTLTYYADDPLGTVLFHRAEPSESP
jgi:hypothetical protein